jgi:branched-chain amino acid transport system permease protein
MTANAASNPAQTPRPGASFWKSLVAGLDRLGFTPLGAFLVILLALLPWLPVFKQEHYVRWLIMGAFLAAQSAAFDFTAGYINVVNFGFAAIVGLGAYTSAILANTSPVLAIQPGISPWIGMFAGALVAAVVGFGLGVLTLRLRGIYAAVMAWFVGIALLGLVRNLTSLTRGPLGISPDQLLNTNANKPYFYVIFGMMLVVYITLKLVVRSHIGLAFKSLGQNMDAARASGVNPTFYRVLNFTLSCAFAGWLGGFYAHYYGSLTPSTVMVTAKTVEVLAIAYIGGRGSLWGGMVVAFPFVILIEILRSNLTALPGLHLVIYGVLMILIMIYYPGGVAGVYYWAVGRIKERRGRASSKVAEAGL